MASASEPGEGSAAVTLLIERISEPAPTCRHPIGGEKRFYHAQIQLNGDQMDKFATVSNAAGLTMAYSVRPKLSFWDYARRCAARSCRPSSRPMGSGMADRKRLSGS